MSPRRVGLAVGLSSIAWALCARAGGSESARFAFLDAPPPEPAPRAPAPAREGDEFARKSWEAFPLAGFAAPFCRGPSFGAGNCGSTRRGTVLGGGALYRITPYVALGAAFSLANFETDAEAGATAYSRSSFMGLTIRGYFADRGAVDPYVETGLGRGTASSGTLDIRSESDGLSTTVGAGVDFWVLPMLKLGPAVSYRWTWLTDVRTCAGGMCDTSAVSDRGAVGSYLSLSLVATLALGHEM
jgi:hypothetical protein